MPAVGTGEEVGMGGEVGSGFDVGFGMGFDVGTRNGVGFLEGMRVTGGDGNKKVGSICNVGIVVGVPEGVIIGVRCSSI